MQKVHICPLFLANMHFSCDKYSFPRPQESFILEVPIRDVVVEPDALSTAELGDDLHNLFLLLWRDRVFTVMDSVVRATATTKV